MSSARKDGVQFFHWAKAAEDTKGMELLLTHSECTDYVYAKFNKVLDMFMYTNEEYSSHLQGTVPLTTVMRVCVHITFVDDSWTREQTDELMELCRRFDLRFPVVHDRISFSRSMEVQC